MSMWLLFECALLKTKVLFHFFITNYFVIELFFSHDQGSIIKSWKLVSYCFQVFKSRMFNGFRIFVLQSQCSVFLILVSTSSKDKRRFSYVSVQLLRCIQSYLSLLTLLLVFYVSKAFQYTTVCIQ